MEVIKSSVFDAWLRRLKDRHAKARIEARILRMGHGNPGDVHALGAGLFEMRIDYGPGYRVYYLHAPGLVVILLCGGDKSTQRADISHAPSIADEWEQQ